MYRGDGDPFTLLVDIKSRDAQATYRELSRELRRYKRMLASFGPGEAREGAVTVVVSGNRPADLLQGQSVRYAAYDGLLQGLGLASDRTLVPMFSAPWNRQFTWRGVGEMSERERNALTQMVQVSHSNGQRVRFYETPGSPKDRAAMCRVWQELLAARVDYINTDHLTDLRRFLTLNDPQRAVPWPASGEAPPPPGTGTTDRVAAAVRRAHPCGATIRAIQRLADGTYRVQITTARGARTEVFLDSGFGLSGSLRGD